MPTRQAFVRGGLEYAQQQQWRLYFPCFARSLHLVLFLLLFLFVPIVGRLGIAPLWLANDSACCWHCVDCCCSKCGSLGLSLLLLLRLVIDAIPALRTPAQAGQVLKCGATAGHCLDWLAGLNHCQDTGSGLAAKVNQHTMQKPAYCFKTITQPRLFALSQKWF